MLVKHCLRIIGQQIQRVAKLLQLMHALPDILSRNMHVFAVIDEPLDRIAVLRIFPVVAFDDSLLFSGGGKIHAGPEWICKHGSADLDGVLAGKTVIHQHVLPAVFEQNASDVEDYIFNVCHIDHSCLSFLVLAFMCKGIYYVN